MAAAFLATAIPAAAGDNTWSNAANNFTWDTASADWTSPTAWNNANVDSAIFGSTGAGTVTIGAPITLRGVSFTANGYTLAGDPPLTLTTGGGGGSVGVGEIQVSSGVTATVNATVSGSVGLSKTGTGTLVVGTVQNYSGTTSVNAGILQLGVSSALAVGANVGVSGGTFDLHGFNQSVGNLALGPSTTANPTVASGTGTLTLGGDITFTGGTGTKPALLSAKMDLGGATRTFTIASPSDQSYDVVISGPIGGSGGLALNGSSSGFLALTAASTYSGPTTINSGTLVAGIVNALPSTTALNVAAGAAVIWIPPIQAYGVTAGYYDQTIGSLAGGVGSEVDYATLTVGGDNTSTTFAGTWAGGRLVKTGTGRLALTGRGYPEYITIKSGTLLVNGFGDVGDGATITLAGGTLGYSGPSATTLRPLTLSANSTIQIDAGGVVLSETGNIDGPGGLTKAGSGTLTLTGANSYSGGTFISNGTLSVPAHSGLGTGNVTSTSNGALLFTSSSITTQSFAMNGGTLAIVAGQTLFLIGSTVSSAIFDGGGTFATDATSGARIVNATTTASVSIVSKCPADQFVHITNGGAFSVAAGVNVSGAGTAIALNGFTNQGTGSVTVGAASQINVANFQSYGTLTLLPATVGASPHQTTLVTNLGTAPLGFNGGSRTFIGTPQTANDPNTGLPTFVAGIDLHGQNAVVAAGLFVNNGYVEDTTNNGQGTATVIADFGSLVKGAGYFQNTVQTINGGKFQAGNSPGKATFGSFVLGPGGVSNYVFAIDDATGAAGPSPDVNGHVSGWGLVRTVAHASGSDYPGDFTWTATPTDKLTVSIQTLLNPTTVGVDVAGPMDHFDPTRPYSWPAVEWTGSYAGPGDAAVLDASTAFDMTGFANPVGGAFGWALDSGGHTLSLTYTPTAVPEPGCLALSGLAAAGWAVRRRLAGRRKNKKMLAIRNRLADDVS